MRRGSRKVWYGILAINIAIILWYWWQGSGSLVGQSVAATAVALGRLAGLLTAASVMLQFVFMSRTPWLERVFGLDKLARVHRINGQLTLGFLLLHPLLLTWGYSQLAGVSYWEQFLSFLFDYEHVLWAGVGFGLFLVVIGTSIAIVRRRLRYESWYLVHLLVYAAVLASFWHQLAVGSDILASRFFYGYWIGLYAVVLTLHAVFRFGRQWYLVYKHRFRVARIERETDQAVSVYISGRDLESFNVEPGQFMIFRFLARGRWWQAHPFSLSMPADGKHIRITVKELGDFTRTLSQVPIGTRVVIDGPYGIFTEWMSVSPKVLLIAGGIGITPIRSLFERMLKRGKDAVLVYANKRRRDIVFEDELKALTQEGKGRVINILSEEPAPETGYVDAEKLTRLVPDVGQRDVYVCGPPPMITAVVATLRMLGVPRQQIHFERFEL